MATKADRFVEEAFLSANSVKQRFPDLSVTLFTDLPAHALCGTEVFDAVEPIESVRGFASDWGEGLLDRVRCLQRTPYLRTLHLDTDTRVLTDELPGLFDLLDEIDVAMVETATDDSFSRQRYGKRMFNGGLVLYRRNEKTFNWLREWAAATERNLRLAGSMPLPPIAALVHIADERVRRHLLCNDQISLVEMLSPEVNKFDLKVRSLDYPWNHRGSRLAANNLSPVKILHSPALKPLTHADILSVAFHHRRNGRAQLAGRLSAYVASKYPQKSQSPAFAAPGELQESQPQPKILGNPVNVGQGQVTAIADSDPVRAIPATAEEAFEQAAALHEERRLAEAEPLYAAALSLDPSHAGALCYLGLLRLQQDRVQESVALLRQAVASDAESSEAHNHLGTALQRLGAYVEALACHERALALAPDYSEATLQRGRALQALGRATEAIACYEAVLADWPDDASDNAEMQLALATALQADGRDEEAFVRYRNAASQQPKLADHLSGALADYAKRHQAAAQLGMQRLNRYIGTFLTNQGNARMGMFPGLTSSAFHDPRRLLGAVALEHHYEAIRSEIAGLASTEFQPEIEGLIRDGSWDVFLLYEGGRKNKENCARCPVLTRVIESHNTVRTHAGLLYVSKLTSGTHIKPHRGPTNMRLRCHLGIRIPEGDCGLRVGGQTRRWQEGKCIVFDDSFEHEVWNHASESRIVLIIDIWHPDLTPMEIAFLEGLDRFASFQAGSLARYWAANEEARSTAGKHHD